MRLVLALLVILVSSTYVFGQTPEPSEEKNISAILASIEKLAISDWQAAEQLFADIQPDKLPEGQKAYYRYLEIYLSTKNRPLNDVAADYKQLIAGIADSADKVRAMKSLLALTAYLNEWESGFILAKDLEKLVDKLGQPALRLMAWKGMLIFYDQVGLKEMAVTTANRILNNELATLEQRCFAESLKNEVLYSQRKVTEKQLNDAIQLCNQTQQSYYTTFNYVHLLDYYIDEEQYTKALIIEEDAAKRVQSGGFTYMQSGFLASQARLRLFEQNYAAAKANALEIVNRDPTQEYKVLQVVAYGILTKISKKERDYQQALEYLEQKQTLEAAINEEKSTKELALQKVAYELKSKENQIELLDRRNQLLETEAALNKQKMKTTWIVLALISIAGVAAVYWAYRSRSISRKMRYLATRDSLTELYNRGYFSRVANQILTRASKRNETVAMLLLDLDHFKGLNDTYGHQVGDWALREVSKTLSGVCCKDEIIGRIGGEEFGILAPENDTAVAFVLAEKCRTAIEEIDTAASGHQFLISASFGVSDTRQVGYSLDNLFSASDLALYQSKKLGRNLVYEYDKQLTPIG